MIRTNYVAAAYLGACLLLGGSGQGIWSNLILNLSALAILVTFAFRPEPESGPAPPTALRWIFGLGIALALVQLLPLPPQLWTSLPGRESIIEGFRLTRTALPWAPISLNPNGTIASLLALLPAGAMFTLAMRSRETSYAPMLIILLLVTSAAVMIGVLQRGGSDFYFYPISNVGASTGFFANANHMGALLLVAIPFLAAGGVSWVRSRETATERSVAWAVLAVLAVTILVGIVANGSLAVLLLGGPVLLLSGLLVLPTIGNRLGKLIGILALGAGLVVGIMLSIGSPFSASQGTSISSRQEMWHKTIDLAATYFPVGSGVGSFDKVYPLAEDPSVVDWVFVNHAHNDFLEIVVEMGLPGLLLVIAFALWWISKTSAIWRNGELSLLARAATIASGALLLHSVVDYPLRTAALSAMFGLCLALVIVRPRGLAASSKWQARHLELKDLRWAKAET